MWGPAADRLLIVGLTGGIASGKSEVTSELARLGAKVVDADQLAREVVLPCTPTHERLLEEFGGNILDGDGRIDRARLAAVVFGDAEKRNLLNGITHPAIFMAIAERLNAFVKELAEGDVPAAVIDAALIVDVGITDVFDLLLVVTSEEDRRVARLLEARGMSPREARDRIDSQVPDSLRTASADILIENNGSLDDLRSRVAEVWREISRKARER